MTREVLHMEEKKEKKIFFTNGILIWIAINLIWWLTSMGLGTYGIDVVPYLSDNAEIVLNLTIFIVGILIGKLEWNSKEDKEIRTQTYKLKKE